MNLSMLDGFLTAIASSPRAVGERHWLPLVLGAAQPTLVTVPRDDERLTVLARSHLAHVAQRLTSDEFKAIVSRTVVPPLTSVASFWCVGYLRGILLRRAAWQSLCERHPGIDSTVLPIVTLAIPADCTKLLPLPKKLRQESERTLPLAVHLLYRVIVEHPRLRRHIDVLHGSAQTGALARVLDALGP